jgi:ribulose-phosphate 3-epimerase
MSAKSHLALKIAPSILAADFGHLAQDLAAVGEADWLHVDVMDGQFVPAISFGAPIIAAAKKASPLPLDVHLMIVNPERHLAAMAAAGADMLTIHLEACPNLHRNLGEIRALGLKAGVALNPHSPAAALTEVLGLVDLILVMTVNPGAGGQAFLSETLPKIRQLRQMINDSGRPIALSVDGGITPHTAKEAIAAGADVLVAGSAIFKAEGGIAAGVAAFKAL